VRVRLRTSPRGPRGAAAALFAALAAWGEPERLPDPRPTDEALVEGRVLTLPVEGAWPRLGIQWTYQVTASGFPAGASFPPRIAYRLTTTEDMGHPWTGWWLYGKSPFTETTGATIRDDDVYFHPPRVGDFRQLEYTPWPQGTPGRARTWNRTLTLGTGWKAEGKEIVSVQRDLGWEKATAPAGAFDRAWHVDGTTPPFEDGPSWKADFWWVPRVGWVLLRWEGSDGRRLELRLEAVRDVRVAK
jgi:hypothetical protein